MFIYYIHQPTQRTPAMNKLSTERRVQILHMLCEGSSMRSVSRIMGVSINTVTKLLGDAGRACAAYHDKTVRNVRSARIQCDEIWSFCYAKQKNVPAAKRGQFGYGDVWTWTAIDADNKLIVSWRSESETRGTQQSLLRTWHPDSRTAFNSRPTDSRHI